MRKAIIAGILSALCTFAQAGESLAASPSSKIYLGLSSVSLDYVPFWYAKDHGLYGKYGLDLDIITTGGGTVLTQALLAGGIPLAGIGGAFLQGAMQGADLVMLAAHMNYFPYRLIGQSSISLGKGLKGSLIGISRFGSSSDLALRVALKASGIDPTKDVTILQLGGQTERFAALTTGRVQATIIAPPLSSAAKKMGFNVILDMARMRLPYPEIGVVSSREFISKNRDTVKRFLQAYLESIRDIKKDREGTVAVMGKYLKLDVDKQREVLHDTYEQTIASGEVERKPYPNLEGVKFAVDLIAKERNLTTTPNPKDYLDTTILEELDRSGFIDKLYKQ